MRSKAGLIFLGGSASNLLVVLLCLPLLRLPAGLAIKPMGLIFLHFLIWGFALGLPAAVAGSEGRPDGGRALRFVGTCLCYTPLPASIALLHFFAWLRGFSFG